jgi:hypothetical protein
MSLARTTFRHRRQSYRDVLRDCLELAFEWDSLGARDVIHLPDVDTREPRPDGRDRPEDQALAVGPDR